MILATTETPTSRKPKTKPILVEIDDIDPENGQTRVVFTTSNGGDHHFEILCDEAEDGDEGEDHLRTFGDFKSHVLDVFGIEISHWSEKFVSPKYRQRAWLLSLVETRFLDVIEDQREVLFEQRLLGRTA